MNSTCPNPPACFPACLGWFSDRVPFKSIVLSLIMLLMGSEASASFNLNAWGGPTYTNDSTLPVNLRVGGYLFDHYNGWYTFNGNFDIGRVESGVTISLFSYIHATSYMWDEWDNFWWNMSEYDFWIDSETPILDPPSSPSSSFDNDLSTWTDGLTSATVISLYATRTGTTLTWSFLQQLFTDPLFAMGQLISDLSLHHDLREILNNNSTLPATRAQAENEGWQKQSFWASLAHNPTAV